MTLYIRIICFSLLIMVSQTVLAQKTTGKASYYSNEFQGKETASGELYNASELTAAHRTLPFNTKIKVTNLRNNKSVIVRINDRGPHKKSRIIDLSFTAAKTIDLIHEGIANVKLEILEE
ncbi:rare lipoprotein A [Formosa agariphila KMM 3901]|uniref:Probable endolytic peptidoglycan transglycosylase RlpA n=1 Tax=Formosa agariphila (strain DSM 15362 / KCTC 12365 / LMG 23005 / KMM 3901 / M-2Alg 35-1) TaxID=1347342 RepID=T2KKE9_FORAG|nr:septal ring lytic transglycosylase RlpA family protein [Formosa agariphila]CDF78891.1 rare lipoprotein A [Formosa agariphila KMM 3901]